MNLFTSMCIHACTRTIDECECLLFDLRTLVGVLFAVPTAVSTSTVSTPTVSAEPPTNVVVNDGVVLGSKSISNS